MRKLYFLLPGTTERFRGGGLFAELKTLRLAQQICGAEVVTYRQRESEHRFLDDILADPADPQSIFVLGWGFDVPKLIQRLGDRPTLYHAHSSGYGFRLPSRIPILAVSRNTLGYWGQQANNSLLYYLPNEISAEFQNRHQPRDIDVLVQQRKSSEYLTQQLLPALESRCQVKVLDSFVEDLAGVFNRSKVYLYDSAEYWAVSGVTEGFGLPPLEAIACGCQVFSSVNHGLADFLDPGFNIQKIGVYAVEYDLSRILKAVSDTSSTFSGTVDGTTLEQQLAPYREAAIVARLRKILIEINEFFDFQSMQRGNIADLTPTRLKKLWFQQTLKKLRQRLF